MLIKNNWKMEELTELYALPFIELISQSHQLHGKFHTLGEVQVCSLISIKTGGCVEDCKYCAQSARYQTSVVAQPLMQQEEVLKEVKKALANGATRICLGAAWRGIREGKQFQQVLEMIKEITSLGVEVCCTLGMLTSHQAKRLKEAGLYAYNHNLDSSEKFYPTIITTRTYQDRLDTLSRVEEAAISVCCGGIIGMGETVQDRLELLLTLCNRQPQPESVPINRLSPIPGTPLDKSTSLSVSIWEMVRLIAVARILMPKAMIRLSAGRIDLSYEQQALCFLAGANSIFAGEKLLTVANHAIDRDQELFELVGLKKRPAFKDRNLL